MTNQPASRRQAAMLVSVVPVALLWTLSTGVRTAPAESGLVFDPAQFTVKSGTVDGRTFEYRAYEGIVYVKNPVDAAYQRMNIYIPTAFYEGGSVGGYTAKTAPIFFANSVGGYMPGRPGGPGQGFQGGPNAALVALSKGYVVAAPGARGRTSRDPSGKYVGKAPAVIVDLKAAVRYLRFNAERMPGDAEKIVSNGTSAGGAVSALLGASGNNPDFVPYLEGLGAAVARDDIYAASAYCPITDLDHADMAYEWQFSGVNEYSGRGGTGTPATPRTMTPEQIALSAALKGQFPAYVNSLGLKKADGTRLTLDNAGNGPFKEHVKSLLMASAQKALVAGKDLSGLAWLTIANGKVTDLDFERYVRFATRMKVTPAFDGLDLGTPENDLFGSETVKARHFTAFGQEHTTVPATLADTAQVRQMNAMNYVGASGTTTAKYWRIRHGSVDRDTSLAVPVMLATKLANNGQSVDIALPWGVPHSGDYDLAELFDWMSRICK